MKRAFSILAGLVLLAASFTNPALAQQRASDSTTASQVRRPLVTWQAGLGFAAVTALAYANDQSIRNTLHDHTSKFGNAVADLGNGFGDGLIVYPVLILGTLTGRVTGAHGLERVSLHALESSALAGGAVMVTKYAVGRTRPFQTPDDHDIFHPFKFKDNALPSGHTAVAFAIATSFAMETKDHWSDAGFYALATVTAFARMHYDKHWASDTVIGAGFGILSARLVNRWNRKVIVGPGVVGASLSF